MADVLAAVHNCVAKPTGVLVTLNRYPRFDTSPSASVSWLNVCFG